MNQSTLKKKYGFENPFKPDPLAKKALTYLAGGGRLLDVGCGEGADSVFYAQHGFRVTSFDRNEEYLRRFRAYRKDLGLSKIRILLRDATRYQFPADAFDVISSLLVVCCMKRSEFEVTLEQMKKSVKKGGVIVMSSRNYLDPEFLDYKKTQKMTEANTYRHKDNCCKFVYFIERGRMREMLNDFEILYYYEGFAPCKYNEHPRHGDSYIICKRKR